MRKVRELVFALDAEPVGQQQWRQLAPQAAMRGKRVAVLPAAAYGGHNDVNEAWVAGTLAVDTWCTPGEETGARLAVLEDLYEAWEERVATLLVDVTSGPRTPHVWPGRSSRGARRPQGPPTLGMTACTPDAVDGPPAHHRADFVVR